MGCKAKSDGFPKALHTIPLFRLLPGLPSRTFSSLTAFLGAIFFLLANVRTEVRGRGEEATDQQVRRYAVANAGPAADGPEKWVGEVKKKRGMNTEVVMNVQRGYGYDLPNPKDM